MDTIDKKDVTERATAGGWVLPDGWTVTSEISPDDGTPMEFDCYTPAQIAAWKNDEWCYVVVCVFVTDNRGCDWGRAILGGVEHGWLDSDSAYIDALDDEPAMSNAVREHDMIGEALRDATAELERFGTPIIVEPDTNYSGL